MLFYNEVEDAGEINMGWIVSPTKKKDHDEILTPRTQNVTIFGEKVCKVVPKLKRGQQGEL